MKTYWFTEKIIFKFSLSVHCFNDWYTNPKICPDLEVSYLIECKLSPEQNTVRMQRRDKQNDLNRCLNALNGAHVTMGPPSIGKTTSINFVYLMIIFVGL